MLIVLALALARFFLPVCSYLHDYGLYSSKVCYSNCIYVPPLSRKSAGLCLCRPSTASEIIFVVFAAFFIVYFYFFKTRVFATVVACSKTQSVQKCPYFVPVRLGRPCFRGEVQQLTDRLVSSDLLQLITDKVDSVLFWARGRKESMRQAAFVPSPFINYRLMVSVRYSSPHVFQLS